MISFKNYFTASMNVDYILENTTSFDTELISDDCLAEWFPSGKEAELWVKKNREDFIKKYGKKRGRIVLAATAWKNFGASSAGTTTLRKITKKSFKEL